MAAMLIVLSPWVFAQQPAGAPTVSLLTCGPGEQIYELEGHTGLRICDSVSDVVVNWGLFDFDSPNFVYRFVKGETDYMVGVQPTQQFLAQYEWFGRSVTEQSLDLTDAQARKIVELVRKSLREEPTYRYNYVLDNCALRPLRLIEEALAPDTLILSDAVVSSDATFRSMMREYHRNYPWYQFGIDLALGPGIDRKLQREEAAFAPTTLQRMLAGAGISGPTGTRPLVSRTSLLVAEKEGGVTAPPTPWYLTPMAAAVTVLVIMLLLTWIDIARRRVNRLADTILFGVNGLAGCLIAFLVFVSVHEATSPNALLLWLNPLCLLVPLCVWSRRGRNFLIYYHFANFAALLAMGILLVAMNQSVNFAFIPLIAADAIRSASYIHIMLCEKKRKKKRNSYQIRYSGSYSCR